MLMTKPPPLQSMWKPERLIFPPGTDINSMPGMVQCGVGGVPAGCMKGHLFNVAPRFGFAYDPTGKGTMAIRGGYGIFFEHTNGNEGNTESLEGSPPLVLSASQFNVLGYENIGKTQGPEDEPLFFPLNVLQFLHVLSGHTFSSGTWMCSVKLEPVQFSLSPMLAVRERI